MGFKGDKNPYHDFRRKGSNAVGPCRKILRHVKDLLRYDRDTDRQNSAAISRPVFRFATRCLLHPEQRTLVDESGIIRTQMKITGDQKIVAVAWEVLCDTTL
jgi:hypothetical protein